MMIEVIVYVFFSQMKPPSTLHGEYWSIATPQMCIPVGGYDSGSSEAITIYKDVDGN